MPDQPEDPIHYEMKIPPEKKKDKATTGEQNRGSEDSAESNHRREEDQGSGQANPAPRSES